MAAQMALARVEHTMLERLGEGTWAERWDTERAGVGAVTTVEERMAELVACGGGRMAVSLERGRTAGAEVAPVRDGTAVVPEESAAKAAGGPAEVDSVGCICRLRQPLPLCIAAPPRRFQTRTTWTEVAIYAQIPHGPKWETVCTWLQRPSLS